jgi:hypothetical protein
MRTVNVNMIKVGLIGFIASMALLVVINQFAFSWAGLILNKIGLCEYKSIRVPRSDGHNEKLSQSYNIPQMTSIMSMNRNYEVNNHYGGDGLRISRMFNGVKYNVIFVNNSGVSEFNLDNLNYNGYPSGSKADGEKCTTPSYFVEKNAYRMIDDLPLNGLQKAELKQYVTVKNMMSFRLF